MYDVVVIGQGLTGMLAAIWAKEQGYRTALAAAGSGKILQSTGVMDLIPGSSEGFHEWLELHQLPAEEKLGVLEAVERFKALTERLFYSYKGDVENPIPIVTGAGYLKKTALYPETITPLPERGRIVVVGFQEISDFQPAYIKGNLQRARPELAINSIKISLGKHSQRTMTQLDAARLLDQKEIRSDCIYQIQRQMAEKNIPRPDLFIFPAALGIENWKETLKQFTVELGVKVTEAPGMPPNATAVRLNERLKKEAVRLGVRFYSDTSVVGCQIDGGIIKSLTVKTVNQLTELSGKQFVLATGGILGGGLEAVSDGIKETALRLETDKFGRVLHCPYNLHPVGRAFATAVTQNGITGGVFSVFSAHDAVCKISRLSVEEGVNRSA